MKINGVRSSKKTYYSPKLNIYGGIRELTQATTDPSPQEYDNDGMTVNFNKSIGPSMP